MVPRAIEEPSCRGNDCTSTAVRDKSARRIEPERDRARLRRVRALRVEERNVSARRGRGGCGREEPKRHGYRLGRRELVRRIGGNKPVAVTDTIGIREVKRIEARDIV